MKMTDADERALAVLGEAHLVISDHKYPDTRKRLREAREYLTARLAADQQKGGGEVAAGLVSGYLPASRCVEIKLDGPIPDWVKELPKRAYLTSTAELEAVGRSGEGHTADWCAGWNAHNLIMSAPQPSIPAPAQQDGKASGGESYDANELLRLAMGLIRIGNSVAGDSGDAVLIERIEQHLAHPPHADQETQG